MAQYTDKSALVAEIKKVYDNDYKFLPSDIVENVQSFKDDLLMNLDTLEVKEVDLEKEIDRYCEPIQAWQIQEAPYTSIEKCARHFYELGLKAQKGE